MRVLVVDDDKLVAVSLKTILEADGEITVVGLGEAGDDAIRLYREQHPDILLMDIRMQGMSGLDAAECILKEDQAAKILFLTTFSDDEYIVKALNMGAKGYLLKQDFESIVPALKAVYGGQSVFGGQIMGKIPVLLAGKGSFSYHDYDISEKEQGIQKAPFGIVGLETAAALTYTALVKPGILTPMQMAEKMSYNPAKILGLDKGTVEAGSPADLTIFDPECEWVIDPAEFLSKGKNTPFGGKKVTGKVMATIVDGEIVYQEK